jgi:CRP-like cAMP-binding protein
LQVSCRFWRGLAADDVKLVASAMIIRTFKKGAIIVKQGDEATLIGLVLTGKTSVFCERYVSFF